jgi:hypothetical protein
MITSEMSLLPPRAPVAGPVADRQSGRRDVNPAQWRVGPGSCDAGMCLWPRSQLSCSGCLSDLGVCDTERAPGYLDDAQLPGLVDELVR